ncbi:hypothetical protein L7F22_053540 [Adiantum nelumboides]|nr:hypothetical protein [Adiantum nelumboides]
MDPRHAQLLIAAMSSIIPPIMQMWEALSSTEDENNSVGQPQEIDDNMVPSFTLLQWGTACAKKVPRYQHNFAEDTIQWYIKPRSSIHWWNHFVFYAHEDDERWRELFRLPYLLFEEVVQYVRDDLQRKNIPPQLAQLPGRLFSVEKKVGIAIMVLASGNSQYHIANTFGCGRSIVSKFLHQFVASMLKNASHLLRWPMTLGELQEVKNGFQAFRGLPNCCGAIDATHFNMTLPFNERNEAWFDRKGNYSMVM